MKHFKEAIDLIKKYEGFNERAYADPATGCYPYTIGFGSQYYPDGSQVKQGQCCSKKKAIEYLNHEIKIINEQLSFLNLSMDNSMRQALLSFIHSVGWDAFLYSSIVDAMEVGDYSCAVNLISQWVFDENHQVIGNLIERRQEEMQLFCCNDKESLEEYNNILLKAFNAFNGAPSQVNAIKALESKINPYILSEFVNNFRTSTEDFW